MKIFAKRIPRTLPQLASVTVHQIGRDPCKDFSLRNAVMTQPVPVGRNSTL
jgi:hypothetical protein